MNDKEKSLNVEQKVKKEGKPNAEFSSYLKWLYEREFKNKKLINPIKLKHFDAELHSKYVKALTTEKNAPKLDCQIPETDKKYPISVSQNNFHQNTFINYVQIYENQTLFKYRLKLKEDTNVDFYYNEMTTVFIHNTIDDGYVFFINVLTKSGKIQNFYGDYRETSTYGDSRDQILRVEKINFYFDFDDNETKREKYSEKYLTDFSICASSDYIYLIWGIIISQNPEKTKDNELNTDIFYCSIKGNNNKWKTMNFPSPVGTLVPRIKATSCIVKKKEKNIMYILGGTGFDDSNYHDYYNIIDRIEITQNDEPNYTRIPKENYKDGKSYKSFNNSILFPLETEEKYKQDRLVLMGGTQSQYIPGQKAKGLYVCLITIEENQKKFMVDFNYGMKSFQKKMYDPLVYDGLNLLISQSVRQYYPFRDKHVNNVVSLVLRGTKDYFEKGIVRTTKTFFQKEKNEKQLVSAQKLPFKNKVIMESMLCKLPFDLGNVTSKLVVKPLEFQNRTLIECKYLQLKFFEIFLKSVEADYILVSDQRPELSLMKFKNPAKKNTTCHFSEDFNINSIEFSFPELKRNKKNYVYSDYLLSQTRMNKYCKFEDKIYILVNNPRDNRNQREIFTFSLNSVDLKLTYRVEPVKVYSDDLEIQGSSILVESMESIYLIGGKIYQNPIDNKEEQKIPYNKIVNTQANSYDFLPNNVKTFIDPYLIIHQNFLFCIDRLQKVDKRNIYGEVLNLSDEGQFWMPFWIDLQSLTIKCSLIDRNCIISQLIPLGKSFLEKKTVLNLLVEYEEKNERRERFIFLNLDDLISLALKKKTEIQLDHVKYVDKKIFLGSKEDTISKEPLDSKHRYLIEPEECYYRIPDLSEDGDKDNELPFFNSNLNVDVFLNLESKAAIIDEDEKGSLRTEKVNQNIP